MKTAAEYVAAVLPPRGQGSQTLLFVAEAEQAVATALADCHRYHALLARAIRNAKTPATPCSLPD